MAGWDQFVSVVVPSLVLGAVWWILFVIFRNYRDKVYTARCSLERKANRPAPLPQGPFSWLSALIAVTEEEIIQKVGLDAVACLRFFKIGIQLFGFSLIFFAILIAVNVKSNGDQDGIDAASMSNIPQKSEDMWAHFIGMYAISLFFYYISGKHYRELVELAQDFKSKPRPHQFCVVVRCIPITHQTTEKFAEFFKKLFPETYHSSYLVHNFTELDKKIVEYTDTVKKLEHTSAAYEQSDKKERPLMKVHEGCSFCACLVGQKVDAIEYLEKKSAELKAAIEEERKKEHQPMSVGFVSFKTLTGAAQAAQMRIAVDPAIWKVQMAPEPRELHWPTLYKQPKEIYGTIMQIATVALVLFWSIPVSFISSLTSLEKLSESLPFLEPLVDANPAVKGFLQGFLPTLAIIVFMALLPTILRAMSVFAGAAWESDVQREVLSKYYFFQVFNVFLVTTLSGTIFQSISDILDDPTSVPKLLASSLPGNALFFINIVILTAFASFAAEICRLVPLIISEIMLRFVAKTEREKRDLYNPGAADYSKIFPAYLLDFVLVMSYCIIAPIIIPFGFLFFVLGHLVWKHQFLYVYVSKFESAGSMWPQMFKYLVSGVLIAQITLIGLIGLKYGYIQAPLLIPLPILTIVFHSHFQGRYRELLQSPNLALIVSNAADDVVKLDKKSLAILEAAYVSPSMTADLDNILDPPVDVFEKFSEALAKASEAAVADAKEEAGENAPVSIDINEDAAEEPVPARSSSVDGLLEEKQN